MSLICNFRNFMFIADFFKNKNFHKTLYQTFGGEKLIKENNNQNLPTNPFFNFILTFFPYKNCKCLKNKLVSESGKREKLVCNGKFRKCLCNCIYSKKL